MLVTLIGKNGIHKLRLPQNPIGNYWVKDENGNKLVNIEGKDDSWQVVTGKYIKAINPKSLNIENDEIKINRDLQVVVDRIILKEYNMYGICIGNIENFYIIYCAPAYEDDYYHFDIRNTNEIYIGKSIKNDIIYDNKLVANTHARIFYIKDKWVIENFDKKFGTFINNKNIENKSQPLKNGDIIYIMGLKIVIMGDSIFVNHPSQNVKFNTNRLVLNNRENNEFQRIETIEGNEEKKLYRENDYFKRSPRLINLIEEKEIKIDEPPQKKDSSVSSFIAVLATSLTMALTMIINIIRVTDGYVSGSTTKKNFIFQMLMYVSMLFGMMIMPLINRAIDKKKKIKEENERQEKYKEYIDGKIAVIDEEMEKQRRILLNNYVSANECAKIILNKENRLWERKIDDFDFLTVRLGIGEVPLQAKISYPEEKFFIEEDELRKIASTVAKKSKTLVGAPITFDLIENNICSIVSKENINIKKKKKNIIIQLITFHSFEDLKLVFLLSEDKDKSWEFVKMLPHVWNSTKEIRFFADKYDDMEKISMFLEEELKERLEQKEVEKDLNYKNVKPYYLIITDDYKKIEKLRIIKEILKQKENLGFGMICITQDLFQLPNETKSFINLNDKEGQIIEKEITESNQIRFLFNAPTVIQFDKISYMLSNIPIKSVASRKESYLPTSFSFLEMYDAGLIEQLNILEKWNNSDTTLSLRAPIGVNGDGKAIYLDAHEKFHGPHGLVAGSTGSGKSEFIITYILSLAVNYHPYDVAFILIDYKGGGLAGAFQKNNMKLPHLVGTITNIDSVGLNRSLASIQSELKRRQVIFNNARNMTDEGTIDIMKYQKLFHDGIVKEPVPHLFIICDEFAELKQQQPDFMDELMSVSRIGRSLGVHLILATQKPAGIVNEQIRSNSRFAICLKVQNKEDSKDMIGKQDAAYLKRTRTILYTGR